jgi:malate/lactate dehydrogenase
MNVIAIYGLGKTGRAIYNKLKDNYKIIKVEKYTFFKKKKLSEADLIILCAGNLSKLLGRNFKSTHDVRLNETVLNKKIVDKFIKLMDNLNKPIIVVTNQSDMFERYLRKNLNRKNIYSFGKSLDRIRFSNYLGKKVNIAGFHGLAIPLIKKNKKEAYLKIMKECDDKMLKSLISKKVDYETIADVFAEDLKKFSWDDKKPKLNKVEKELLGDIQIKFNGDYNKIFK